MKKYKISFIILILIFIIISCDNNNQRIESLKKFGQESFERAKWISGGPAIRGKMIYSYLTNRMPIQNLSIQTIREELGDSTAYYMYDSFPAYYIGPKSNANSKDPFLLAFIIDHKTGKVKDIHIEPAQ